MLLLDTHVLVWWTSKIEILPMPVNQEIKSAQKKNALAISSMTLWEIAMLYKKGRLTLKEDIHTWINKITSMPFISIIPADHQILVQSVFLQDPFHADPADRIIVATAQIQGITLVTKDKKILKYPHVKAFWNE